MLEFVILLHGIGHAAPNMYFMEKALEKQEYEVVNISYPSRKHTISDLSKWLNNKLTQEKVWQKADKVHFVTHSMGGLVSGFYLQDYKNNIPANKMGRVVMLGTPHGGSEVADALSDLWIYKKIFGPAGQELTTTARLNNKITPWYDLGIIAGTKNWLYPLGNIFIKDEHDGSVSLSSTKLGSEKEHVSLPVMHGFMSWSPEIHRHTVSFLKSGSFK